MFTKQFDNYTPFKDNVFEISTIAKKDLTPGKINATIGALSDEEGKIITFKTVFDNERKIPDAKRAAYAAGLSGDPEYLTAVKKYLLEDRVKVLESEIIATPGGTGALSLAVGTCLDEGETLIFPEVSWGNYKNIADEAKVKKVTYDVYDLNSLLNAIDSTDGKFILIVNSPCENPCGHEYTLDEWSKIIAKLNSLDRKVILLADVAYIDFAYSDGRACFELFDEVSDNVLTAIAFSASKSFSYYGERVGALLFLHRNGQVLSELLNHFTKHSRATWSNVNASAMINIAEVLNKHLEEYKKEKQIYVNLLKARSDALTKKLTEAGIDFYPYSSGFFITLKMTNEKRDIIHSRLFEKHIYTVKVNNGIRIGVCSLQLSQVEPFVNALIEALD